MRVLSQFLCMLPMAVARSPLGSLRYVMYFRFVEDIVFLYNGPNSGMNYATKNRFYLNLLIYREVGRNSIS